MTFRLAVIFLCVLLSGGCQTAATSSGRTGGSEIKSTAPSLANAILASDMSFDMASGEIKYTLPEDALVRIRIGVKNGGAMLITLLDWEHRAAGVQLEVWDKKDSSGGVDFSRYDNLMLVLSCLPGDPAQQPLRKGNVKGLRRSPRMSVSFSDDLKHNARGQPVVAGVVPMRVTIDPTDVKWLAETKYELGVFIDNIFLAEDEEGINPYTYHFNTKGLNNGTHIVTANIIGYDGEIGTQSVLVDVKN
jgi:hypothetical protein